MQPINFTPARYTGASADTLSDDASGDIADRRTGDRADARTQNGNGAGTTHTDARFQGMPVAVGSDIFSLIENAEELAVELVDDIEAEMAEEDEEEDVRFDEPHGDVSDEQITAYFGASKHTGDVKRAELVAEMMSGRHHQIRERLRREQPDDPTAQFLTLQQALHEGERRVAAATLATGVGSVRGTVGSAQPVPSAEALTQIRQAMEDIELNHGPQLRADLNTIGVAGAVSDTAAGVRQFQSRYRDIVLGAGTLADTLQLVLDDFAGDDAGIALTRLTQALGSDLASIRPSTDPVRLHALIQDQFLAETAMSVLERCRTLVGPDPVIVIRPAMSGGDAR